MTHDEYVSRLESWTDEESASVLEHTAACAECGRDARIALRALHSLEPPRPSRVEEVLRVAAAAAVIALVVWAVPAARTSATPARYRIVGTAAGVVAETPEGLVAAGRGVHRNPSNEKEASR